MSGLLLKGLKTVAAVVAIVSIGLVGLHVYVDHQLLHILVEIEAHQQQQIREGK